MRISSFKRLLSYLYPVRLRIGSSIHNPVLELLLYQGRLQLATADALYSDGAAYRPLRLAFGAIPAERLQRLKSILLLGTGLASAIDILQRSDSRPHYTLVELDETVLQWALETHEDSGAQLRPVCMDAQAFIAQDTGSYDMVVIDIFSSRVVPSFATTTGFLQQCRQRVSAGGIVIINYIEHQADEWAQVQQHVLAVFPTAQVLRSGINRVVVATV